MNGCMQENLVYGWKDTVGKISDANGLEPWTARSGWSALNLLGYRGFAIKAKPSVNRT